MLYLPELKKSNDHTWLTDALRNKREDRLRLKNERENIKLKYSSYDDYIIDYAIKPPASSYASSISADDGKIKSQWSIKKILIDYYENSPTHLSKLISERRRKHELDSCPYCGKPVVPSTLDHFLPKEDWPEFSIYPDNLVPQCSDCAPIKGRKYYCSTENSAMFIHPFYSSLLSQVGFEISATLMNNDVSFNVRYKLKDIDESDRPRVRLHIHSLKITRRIKEYCDVKLKRIIRKSKKSKNSIAGIINCYMPEVQSESYLLNNWKDAFYSSINQQEIIQYIDSFRQNQVSEIYLTSSIQYEEIE